MVSVKLKVAVVPLKLAVATTTPFFSKDTEVIPVVEAPVSVRVKLLRVTLLLPGLFNWICWTVTPVVPWIWVEFPGGLGPWEACSVTTVGVAVRVIVAVALLVVVKVGV